MLRLKVERLTGGNGDPDVKFELIFGSTSLGMDREFDEDNDHRTLKSLGITDGSQIVYVK